MLEGEGSSHDGNGDAQLEGVSPVSLGKELFWQGITVFHVGLDELSGYVLGNLQGFGDCPSLD